MAMYNILVKLLDGKTIAINFPNPNIQVETLKSFLYSITHIPPHHQRLISGTQDFSSQTLIPHPNESTFLTVNLLVPLLGGKGGFGSQLRRDGAKRKTTNFDSCRDLNGRRIRYVNAEKKLQEWHNDADGRKLEEIAENFCKNKMKDAKKSRESEAQKYVEEYRESSSKCVGIIEASVRDSIAMHGFGLKRLKVSSIDGFVKAEKNVTLDNEPKVMHCHNVGEADVDISTITTTRNDCVSNFDEVVNAETKATLDIEHEAVNCHIVGEADGNTSTITTTSASDSDFDKPLDFGDYDSAKEMEVLGNERLKFELQTRGLKFGGTLGERATRLFLLKTTPVNMLPKKLFAKK
ncbi:hypothetical protein ACHQM5_001900 [Ranunculus cassubicifolius]